MKLTNSYCEWVNGISARYDLGLVEYCAYSKSMIMSKLTTSKDNLIIGIHNDEDFTGKIFDRRKTIR